jgi:hypothetical protein
MQFGHRDPRSGKLFDMCCVFDCIRTYLIESVDPDSKSGTRTAKLGHKNPKKEAALMLPLSELRTWLNMELDLQSSFGLLCTATPPLPSQFGLIYEGAIGQPR